MQPSTLNIVGLVLGILGVLVLFFMPPPQPDLEGNVSLGLEDNTYIEELGKTVAEYKKEAKRRRTAYSIMSKIGLFLVLVGFSFQLLAALNLGKSSADSNPERPKTENSRKLKSCPSEKKKGRGQA